VHPAHPAAVALAEAFEPVLEHYPAGRDPINPETPISRVAVCRRREDAMRSVSSPVQRRLLIAWPGDRPRGGHMPKVSKDSATGGGDFGPVTDRAEDLEGYSVHFTTFHEDVDGTPLMKGLPDDRCQCPHWGYVIAGRMTFQFPDREEVFDAGDAFYTPPGHIPVKHQPGTEVVMFSPAEEMAKTEAAMMRNMPPPPESG